jgi:apolipoprotein N-acyltransferase
MLIIKHKNHLAKWSGVHFPYIAHDFGWLSILVFILVEILCLFALVFFPLLSCEFLKKKSSSYCLGAIGDWFVGR